MTRYLFLAVMLFGWGGAMSKIETVTKCPTCGSEVTVGGKGETHYYIPLINKFNARIKELEDRMNPTERYWFHECGRRDLQIAELIRKNGELERELKTLKGEKP